MATIALSAAIGVAFIGARAAWPHAAHRSGAPAFTPAAIEELRVIGHKLASASGGNPLTSIDGVSTIRQASQDIDTQATVTMGDLPVYFVTMQGNFRATFLPQRAPIAAPQGTQLSFTYDPASQQVLDITVTRSAPNLAALGAVTPITP